MVISPARHGCIHDTFWKVIFTSLEASNRQWYWKCDWTITVRMHMVNQQYQQNSHTWQTWQLCFRWHRRGNRLVFRSPHTQFYVGSTWKPSGSGLFHSATVSQCDHFGSVGIPHPQPPTHPHPVCDDLFAGVPCSWPLLVYDKSCSVLRMYPTQ